MNTNTYLTTNLTTNFRPFSIGLEKIFDLIDTNQFKGDFYPPYNILKKDNKYTIEIALAGFDRKDIDIELKENCLVISGKNNTEENNDSYIYRGIANRYFSRSFNLANTIVIKNAEFKDGMLKIHLENEIPEHMKPRKIEISSDTNLKRIGK